MEGEYLHSKCTAITIIANMYKNLEQFINVVAALSLISHSPGGVNPQAFQRALSVIVRNGASAELGIAMKVILNKFTQQPKSLLIALI